MNKKLFFSVLSGVIYELPEDMKKSLDQYQIPLTKKPPSNCNKCYGRLYTGYNLSLKVFNVCPRCGNRFIDHAQMKNDLNIETPKQTNEIEFVDTVNP